MIPQVGDKVVPPIITGEFSRLGTYINITMSWGTNVPARPEYMPRSPYNMRATARRVRDDFRSASRCDIDFRRSISFNPVANPRVKRRVDEREGPVDQ